MDSSYISTSASGSSGSSPPRHGDANDPPQILLRFCGTSSIEFFFPATLRRPILGKISEKGKSQVKEHPIFMVMNLANTA